MKDRQASVPRLGEYINRHSLRSRRHAVAPFVYWWSRTRPAFSLVPIVISFDSSVLSWDEVMSPLQTCGTYIPNWELSGGRATEPTGRQCLPLGWRTRLGGLGRSVTTFLIERGARHFISPNPRATYPMTILLSVS